MGYLDLAKSVSRAQTGLAGYPGRAGRERERSEISEKTPRVLSHWDVTPDQWEAWAERVCIMHYDGRLPWEQAEALALVEVFGQVRTDCADL